VQLDHPSDDARLPSYKHPTLRELEEDLQRSYDCFHMLRGVKQKYLPQEPKEPDDAYKARLNRSVFADFLRGSIVAFAGVLSKFTLRDAPESFEAVINNVDLEGNSFAAFMQRADALMLRDGGTLLCVDMPSGKAQNRAEEIALGRRPYLLMRPRTKVLNWRVSVDNGVETLEQVCALELVDEPDGDFGVKTVPRYRVITREGWTVYRIERNASNDLVAVIDSEGTYEAADGGPLPMPPVVWYPADEAGFGQGELPLRQVQEHSIEHFQQRSDLREKTHRLAMPVPVRIGATPPAPGESRRPLVIGPNSVVDLEPGGSFTFAEPSASSLAEQRAQINEVEKLISRQTLGFLYGDPGATKTAMQAGLEGAQTEATISSIAERKASVVQSIMAIWCAFTGENLPEDAGISMSPSLFERPLEAVDIDQLQKLTGGAVLMSQQSAIEELQRRGRLTVTTSVEDEMERIRQEMPEPADPIDLNDLGGLPPLPPALDDAET
jgi:hypothetical protein